MWCMCSGMIVITMVMTACPTTMEATASRTPGPAKISRKGRAIVAAAVPRRDPPGFPTCTGATVRGSGRTRPNVRSKAMAARPAPAIQGPASGSSPESPARSVAAPTSSGPPTAPIVPANTISPMLRPRSAGPYASAAAKRAWSADPRATPRIRVAVRNTPKLAAVTPKAARPLPATPKR